MPRDDTHSERAAVARPGVSQGHSLIPPPRRAVGCRPSPSGRLTPRRPTRPKRAIVDHRPRRPVVVVVSGGCVVVVSGGCVVGGAVVVVSGAVVVVSGAVVAVTGGCVVVAGAWVGGVVVVVVVEDSSAESGRVDTFDALALGGVVVLVFLVWSSSSSASVVDVVLDVASGGWWLSWSRHRRRGPCRAVVFSRACPCTLIGWSSSYTVTNKATSARRTADRQPNCKQPPPFSRSHGPTLWEHNGPTTRLGRPWMTAAPDRRNCCRDLDLGRVRTFLLLPSTRFVGPQVLKRNSTTSPSRITTSPSRITWSSPCTRARPSRSAGRPAGRDRNGSSENCVANG